MSSIASWGGVLGGGVVAAAAGEPVAQHSPHQLGVRVRELLERRDPFRRSADYAMASGARMRLKLAAVAELTHLTPAGVPAPAPAYVLEREPDEQSDRVERRPELAAVADAKHGSGSRRERWSLEWTLAATPSQPEQTIRRGSLRRS